LEKLGEEKIVVGCKFGKMEETKKKIKKKNIKKIKIKK